MTKYDFGDDYSELLTDDQTIEIDDLDSDESQPVRCSLITGAAGTGKTYSIRRKIADDPDEGVLCATTGIAAVNLNTVTINSLLKYFDTESLTNAYISGRLVRQLSEVAKSVDNLYVDEMSMMAAEQLDIIYQAIRAANRQKKMEKINPRGLGITLTGDFAQLPPIKARWAFEAECWPEFERGLTRLEKNYRQGEGGFLEAINHLRAGHGDDGAEALSRTPAEFSKALDLEFPGTTIMSKNDEVDKFNWVRLRRLTTRSFKVRSNRWSVVKHPGEWKLIPDELELKAGAYVMILANDTVSGGFEYANGDCGWVEDVDPRENVIFVRLARNDEVVEIRQINRYQESSDQPRVELDDDALSADDDDLRREPIPIEPVWGSPWFNQRSGKYVVGAVRYFPLRLAYASTVHKSQGLTLDRCQLDIRNAFFGTPAMTYVAVSRCRTAEGLRIVGSPQLLAQRCKIDPKISRWI